MISDPRTTPDSRAGRVFFGVLVAVGALYVQFVLFRHQRLALVPRGLLAARAPRRPPSSRPALRVAPERAPAESPGKTPQEEPPCTVLGVSRLAAALWRRRRARRSAFCGFYVAKADAQLFNHASQVALVRDGDHTVMTMANDFRGEPKEFAVVSPFRRSSERGQIDVASGRPRPPRRVFGAAARGVLRRRPVPAPCTDGGGRGAAAGDSVPAPAPLSRAKSLGVTIEAQYTVGEYDILILSAKESGGLETWLVENGYRIPNGAGPVLGSYIAQNMRFFVARVNLKEQAKLGFTYLRPLRVSYDSPKFMLPIRLGTVNADGPQELFVFALTRKGRVETTNYRTVRLPTGMDVPVFVKAEFGEFYRRCSASRSAGGHARGLPGIRVGHELVRSVRGRPPVPRRAEDARRLVARRRDRQGKPVPRDPGAAHGDPAARRGRRLPDATARAVRQRAFSRGPRVPGDRGPPELPGALRAAPPLDGRRHVPAPPTTIAATCPSGSGEAQTLATLTGWDIATIRRKMNLGPRSGEQAGRA